MNEAQKIYSEYRNELLKRQLSNNENYDKAILTLSSSGLALSLAIYNLSSMQHQNTTQLLVAWSFYLLAIFISISAYLISNKAIDKQIDIAERYYLKQELNSYNEKNWFSWSNNLLNPLAGFSLILAVIFTLLFFYQTVKLKEAAMSNDDKVIHTNLDSATTPQMVTQNSIGELAQNSAQVPRMQAMPATPTPAPKDENSK